MVRQNLCADSLRRELAQQAADEWRDRRASFRTNIVLSRAVLIRNHYFYSRSLPSKLASVALEAVYLSLQCGT